MNATARRRLMLAATLAMLVASGFLLHRGGAALERNAREFSIREDGGATVIRWSGTVRAPMGRMIERAAKASASPAIIVELNSPGGSIAEGRRVIEGLDRIAAVRRLATRVRAGEACLSMCVPIYLRGEARVAGASALFMFHEPQRFDAVTDERVEAPGFEQRRTSRRFVARYLENSPIDKAWLARTRPLWREQEVWRDAQALVDEGANIVQAID